jgi:predicted naringenin-chalcone synthase
VKATGTGNGLVAAAALDVASPPPAPTVAAGLQIPTPAPQTGAVAAATRPLPQSVAVASHTGPRIAGLAVSDTETTLSQDDVLDRLGLRGDEFAEGIFSRCGVTHRHLHLHDDFLARTSQGRSAEIERELMRHAIRAVDRLGVDPAEIGTVVTSSLYSLGCPSLAHRLVDHYGMDPCTDKYHVVGVGCASAVPLMRLTAQSLPGHPGKHGLVVAAESMSGIQMQAGDDDPRAKVIGSAIFGDGCAAALLTESGVRAGGAGLPASVGAPGADGPAILATQVHQIGGTLGAVSLQLAPHDSYLHLARDLPDLAGAGLGELVDEFLRRNRSDRADVDHWLVHPGGRRIIESVQDALGLSDDDVAVSREVLADHGNVGTPSIFYVLQRTVERRRPRAGERGLAVTVGPGVTVGLMLLQW